MTNIATGKWPIEIDGFTYFIDGFTYNQMVT